MTGNRTHVRISREHWQMVRQLGDAYRLPHCHVVGMVIRAWGELDGDVRRQVRDRYLAWKASLARGALSIRNECWLDAEDYLVLESVHFEMSVESITDAIALCCRGWYEMPLHIRDVHVQRCRKIVLKRDGRRRVADAALARERVH